METIKLGDAVKHWSKNLGFLCVQRTEESGQRRTIGFGQSHFFRRPIPPVPSWTNPIIWRQVKYKLSEMAAFCALVF